MLEFSEKLTLIPSAITEADIESLRGHDFSDRDILSIILAGAYRNYIVRVADALGVELNPTVEYAPELIAAFGLDEGQARETLYGDRQQRNPTEDVRPPAPVRETPLRFNDESRDCWIGADPTQDTAEDFAHAKEKLLKLSAPHPMHKLAQGFALRPDALDVTADYWGLLSFGGSSLGARLEGLVGLSVAHTLSCHYMGTHHARRLLEDGMSPEQVKGLVNQSQIHTPENGVSEPREREAVRFCVHLTQSPWTMARSDLDPLREAGFSDREILTLAAGTSLENFLCRVADALGLHPETQLGGTPTVPPSQHPDPPT